MRVGEGDDAAPSRWGDGWREMARKVGAIVKEVRRVYVETVGGTTRCKQGAGEMR